MPTSSTKMVLLLSAAVFINYVDRGNLATAAPLIQDELRLSSTQLGWLLSGFFWSYVPAMVPAGWIAERYGARPVLAAGVAIWSIATLLSGFAGGFMSILLLRLLLGIGESAAFPCASKLIASHVDAASIGLANGVLGFGYLIGPAVGTVLGGLLMPIIGWRPVFVLFGSLSMLWLWPWRRLVIAASPTAQLTSLTAIPSFGAILKERGLWGASIGLFASNYNFYFILAWLPLYLVKIRGFSMQTMAGVAGTAYLINAVSALCMGWLTDRWIRAGRSATVIYKSVMAVNHIASIACMAGMVLLPLNASVACLFGYEVVLGLSSPGVYAISQILAGPAATGRWVGVQNTCGNVAGILAPPITGMLIDATGQFTSAFAIAGIVNLLGVAGWIFLLPKVAPLRWDVASR